MSTVALFPGQGALTPAFLDEARRLPTWSATAAVIDDATNGSLSLYVSDVDPQRLVDTDRAQLVTFAISMATWEAARSSGVPITHMIGHSLGELSALTAAGVLTLTDGATLVHRRGVAMRQACQHTDGTMAALMGPVDGATRHLDDAHGVWVANMNGPGQLVISGYRTSVSEVCADSPIWGWKRATALSVDGAFHSPLMASAQHDLDAALATTTFSPSTITVLANVDARAAHGDEWRDRLSRQLQSAVLFNSCVRALPDSVTTGVEVGPGSTLIGLTKRIRSFDTLSRWEFS